jgi:mRNA-degrading endonuclease RelE of RelBE toxin-antitoxin system
MANVLVESHAQEQFRRLPQTIARRVWRLYERLKHWPVVSGAKALSGNLAGKFRLRTGDYRVQFRIEGEDVIVEKIGHRSTFYEE